ncbi:MAG: hypothetical protein U9Q05_06590 [Thermodesulfobacteriota bacterium]|nr:hypothetical protein [Thermodesulfobacteriota bacterium]
MDTVRKHSLSKPAVSAINHRQQQNHKTFVFGRQGKANRGYQSIIPFKLVGTSDSIQPSDNVKHHVS